MDALAKAGEVGFVHTTPAGMPPGSDICNLSVFGYNPAEYYTGRSPLEALSMGISLGPSDMAFRCNLVSLSGDGLVMEDFSARHIKSEYAAVAIKRLNELFKDSGVEFYQGLSYRNLMVLRGYDLDLLTTPPHDITGREIAPYLPAGEDGAFIYEIMGKARRVFDTDTGGANSIWLWGQGRRPEMPSYKELYGLDAAVIAAVDLIKGIGICAGMEIINVPGATGFIDTNFEGKAAYAIEALKSKDYVYVHVEAPDEAGHMGSIEHKVAACEAIDSRMLPIITDGLKAVEHRIALMPDHLTPVRLMTHTSAPVPAIICGTGIHPDSNSFFSENIERPSFEITEGWKMAERLFRI
jgi:2,3-bisphosphoglycerate-independent phosphoglycerate mutase